MFGRALKTPMNAATKYLLNEMITDEKWTAPKQRGVLVPKGLGFVNIFTSSFHSVFSFFSLLSYIICFIAHFISTPIIKNECCVFLASTPNRFCLIENAVQYLATVIIWGAFRIQSSVYDETFCKHREQLLAVDFFRTKNAWQCSEVVSDYNRVKYLNRSWSSFKSCENLLLTIYQILAYEKYGYI